jgi:hypothetical protein
MLPRKLSQAPSRKVCKLESESLCVAIYNICPLIINCFSVGKDSFNIPEIVLRALAETALWLLPEGLACAIGAKPNVPFVRLAKIELKKMCGGENKKYRRVGKVCRLSCCPVAIWSLCRWLPVKISVSFYVYSRQFGRCCVVC